MLVLMILDWFFQDLSDEICQSRKIKIFSLTYMLFDYMVVIIFVKVVIKKKDEVDIINCVVCRT